MYIYLFINKTLWAKYKWQPEPVGVGSDHTSIKMVRLLGH